MSVMSKLRKMVPKGLRKRGHSRRKHRRGRR